MTATALPKQTEIDLQNIMINEDGKLKSTIQLPDSYMDGSYPFANTLNDPTAVKNALDETIRNRILRMHGIPSSQLKNWIHEYVISIFQTEILVSYRSQHHTVWLKQKQRKKTYQRVSLTHSSNEAKRVHSMAIRALYALGLDYGVVICGVQPSKKLVVHKVIPGPNLNREMEKAFCEAVGEFYQSRQKMGRSRVTLGADPEFVMVGSKGNLLMASHYFPVNGRVGCDAIWLGAQRSNKPLVEIRPEPSTDPKQLLLRIYQHLWQASRKMKKIPCKWLAGSLPYRGFPIGGHIHFTGIPLRFQLLRALDNYLTLPLVMIEDKKGRKRRPKYGFLGDYRMKSHGGFEYRTPPSWLVSPTLSKGILILAKLIAESYDQLRLNPLADPDMQEAYYQGDKERIKNWWHLLWRDIERLDGFTTYRNELLNYYRFLTAGIDWDEKKDIRLAWRLPPYQKRY